MNDLTKNIILWVVIAVVLLAVFSNFGGRPGVNPDMPYSQFLTEVENNSIKVATIKGEMIVGTRTSGEAFSTYEASLDRVSSQETTGRVINMAQTDVLWDETWPGQITDNTDQSY